jgi:hypothetical protein
MTLDKNQFMADNIAAQSTAHRFRTDLDDLATALIDKFGLKFNREQANLSAPLLRWLDFRHRYVDAFPRPVVFSDKFPIANLPSDAKKGLQQLIDRFENGDNVNPYQGRGLILRNDTSSGQRHARTDLLFADWGILHFHLSTETIPQGRFFSKPADYLAFCLVGGNVVAVLDVLPHPDKLGFANIDLFETMARSWPEYMEQFKLVGMLNGRTKAPTTEEISGLREAGMGMTHFYKSVAYSSPGGGVTSASTPLRLTRACDQILELVRQLAMAVDDPAGQFRMHPSVAAVSNPTFALGIGNGGLCVVEAASKTDFLLPQALPNTTLSWMQVLNDGFAPQWAAEALCPVDA